MKLTKLRIFLLLITVIILAIVSIVFYLYQKGSVEHYVPPTAKTTTPEVQVLDDLSMLSQAIEAYYSINLKYPERLDNLQPDFVLKIPVEPMTGKQYEYKTDGTSKYRITVSNPGEYNFTILAIENGKVIKQ